MIDEARLHWRSLSAKKTGMTLEEASIRLKEILSSYNNEWILGDLSATISTIDKSGSGPLQGFHSPFRQLSLHC